MGKEWGATTTTTTAAAAVWAAEGWAEGMLGNSRVVQRQDTRLVDVCGDLLVTGAALRTQSRGVDVLEATRLALPEDPEGGLSCGGGGCRVLAGPLLIP